LATALREDLLAVYEANRESGAYRIDAESIGRRSLKNLCLGYLMQIDDEPARQQCAGQYAEGGNMTDVMAALSLLANSEAQQRQETLQDFHDRWRDDPLVLDKWFSVQAMSKRADTLQQVIDLMEHPAFSIRNPNKVRALVGAFCSGNPYRFHVADGSGYAFLADRVLELNSLNPQVAARMLRIMSRWQRYDAGRQGLIRSQLQRILGEEGLSKDVYEVASKSLGDD
jgi:aminopeptidase N